MVPASDLGLYAVASTMASMAYPFSTAIASVTFPRIARRDIGHESRRSLEDRSLALTLAVSVVVSCAVAVAAQRAIPWLFGEQFSGAAVLTWWLVPAMVLRSCSQVVSAYLRGRGRPGSVTWAQIGGLLGAAIGILTLTPVHGMAGTAMGVAASEVIVLVWTYTVLARVRGISGSNGRSRSASPRHSGAADKRP
jgi:O-antigen/teichoic acid export membrane protein